ncbi:hypothetical protein A3Q56_05347 [Intoshia linei]|uniref:Transposase Tc1-like domain-containing protein n=1 Tax=Intoshia linei TaxID=1819745 RepID=A0A177AZW7_9BILA|nr:hypothetical protein A3Q56_05347 [Intoshia linei]
MKKQWTIDASNGTVCRRLIENGIKCYAVSKRPRISVKKNSNRLSFCSDHCSWSIDDGKK